MTAWLSYLGTWIGVEAGRLAARAVPARQLHRLSDAIAGTGFRLAGGFRHRSIRNLETALGDALDGPAIEGIARRSLRSFFRACVELAVALESSPEQFRSQTALVGLEHLEAAAARGRGVIALSAHLGNFLLVGSRLAVEGYSTSVLINQPREGRRARLLDTYRLPHIVGPLVCNDLVDKDFTLCGFARVRAALAAEMDTWPRPVAALMADGDSLLAPRSEARG